MSRQMIKVLRNVFQDSKPIYDYTSTVTFSDARNKLYDILISRIHLILFFIEVVLGRYSYQLQKSLQSFFIPKLPHSKILMNVEPRGKYYYKIDQLILLNTDIHLNISQ